MDALQPLPPRPCSHALRLRLQNFAAFPAPTGPAACRSLAAVIPTRALAHVGTAASLARHGQIGARGGGGSERKPAARHRPRARSTAAASAESEPPKRSAAA
ncbi:hypothetical protein U9M48_004697 [Paspalum notatum var. saurae]|uniref:Uncharacterized protein n=1 Tax=Paspalum notatum var. saurae TaxID=547442 RepID=A0AAQ3PTT4_PASNO